MTTQPVQTFGQRQLAILIEEIEWQLECGQGEHQILAAIGYTQNQQALKRRLHRAGRFDLIERVFTWRREQDNTSPAKKALAIPRHRPAQKTVKRQAA